MTTILCRIAFYTALEPVHAPSQLKIEIGGGVFDCSCRLSTASPRLTPGEAVEAEIEIAAEALPVSVGDTGRLWSGAYIADVSVLNIERAPSTVERRPWLAFWSDDFNVCRDVAQACMDELSRAVAFLDPTGEISIEMKDGRVCKVRRTSQSLTSNGDGLRQLLQIIMAKQPQIARIRVNGAILVSHS